MVAEAAAKPKVENERVQVPAAGAAAGKPYDVARMRGVLQLVDREGRLGQAPASRKTPRWAWRSTIAFRATSRTWRK